MGSHRYAQFPEGSPTTPGLTVTESQLVGPRSTLSGWDSQRAPPKGLWAGSQRTRIPAPAPPLTAGALWQTAEFQKVEELEQLPHPEGHRKCLAAGPSRTCPNIENTPAGSLLYHRVTGEETEACWFIPDLSQTWALEPEWEAEKPFLFSTAPPSVQFSHSVVSDSATPWTAARQASWSPSPTPGVHPNSCP